MWPLLFAALAHGVHGPDVAVTVESSAVAPVAHIGPRPSGAPPPAWRSGNDDDGAALPTGSLSRPAREGPDLSLAGIVRFVYEHTTGSPFGDEVRGARFGDLLLVGNARFGETVLYVETDFADGTFELVEAWADMSLDKRHRLRVGQVERAFLASQDWAEDALPMIERSRVDEATTIDAPGAMLTADYGRLRLAGTLQNAETGPVADWRVALRGEFDVLGRGAAERGDQWRSPKRARLTIGSAVADDGGVEEGSSVALDAAFRWEGFGAFLEWVDLGRDIGDARPYAATVSAALDPDVLELAARYEDLDDAAGTTVIGVALTRWVAPGRLKVQIGADRVRSDDGDLQGTRFLLATVLSFW